MSTLPSMTIREYRRSKGLPADGLGIDHSTLSRNGRISQAARNHTIETLNERFRVLEVADAEYRQMVISGQMIDPSGEYSIEKEFRRARESAAATITSHAGQITFYTRVGTGKRGKVKPSFQKIIDHHQAEIDKLKKEYGL